MKNNLTWEDVRRIVVLSEDVFEEGNNLSEQEFYEEILRRFNDNLLKPIRKNKKIDESEITASITIIGVLMLFAILFWMYVLRI